MSLKPGLFKNWSVKKIWVVLNLVIMLVPVVISLFIYLSLYHIIEGTVNQDSVSLLRQLQQETDGRISDMQSVALQVSTNEYVKSILGATDVSDPFHGYNIGEIEVDLDSYKTANSYIDNIVINFRNCGKLVSNTKSYDNALLDTGLLDETIMTSRGWDDIFAKAATQRLVYINNATNANVGKMMYIQPILVDGPTDYSAVLAITFNSSQLTDVQKDSGVLGNSGFMYIIDKDNNIISTDNEKKKIPSIPFSRLNNGKTIDYSGSQGKMKVVSFNSQFPEWKYVFALPVSVITQKVQFVRNVILFGILLCIALGGLTAMAIARRNYAPVEDLVRTIAKGGISKSGHKSNEFGYIRDSIIRAYDENKKAVRELDQQKNYLRLNFLAGLIKGTIDKDLNMEKLLADYNIVFQTDLFTVLLFYCENCGDLAVAEKGRNDEPNFELAKFAISNVFGEMLARRHVCYFTEMDGVLGCLVNAGFDTADSFSEDIRQACDNGLAFVGENLHMAVHVSAGMVCKGVDGISAAFQQALDALEYRTLYPSDSMLYYEKVISPQLKNSYSLKDEQLLANYIKSGDVQNAQELVKAFFRNYFGEKKMPFSELKSLLYDLNRTMFTLAGKLQTSGEPEGEAQAIFNELMRPKQLGEVEKSYLQMIEGLCRTFNSRKTDRSAEISVSVVTYVAAHYMENDLSVAGIADALGITPSYLSKIFKEHRDKSIVDYISEVRLGAAKGLLEQSRLSLNLIAEKVGYIDSSAFIRAFKRYEGITPGKYRDIKSR